MHTDPIQPLLSGKELWKPPTFRRLSSLVKSQNNPHVEPFLRLPYELCRLIFETAAEQCLPTALALSVVSRDVNAWVTPVIYRRVTPKSNQIMHKFIDSVTKPESSDSLLRHVTTLNLLFAPSPDPFARLKLKILSRCRNLERLLVNEGFCEENASKRHISSIERWPHPWEVILLSQPSPPILNSSKLPMLQFVTHLYLGLDNLVQSLTMLGRPNNLPNLSHLGFSYWPHLEPLPPLQKLRIVFQKLMLRPGLKMLLVCHVGATDVAFWSRDDLKTVLKECQDGRIYVGPYKPYSGIQPLFQAGESLWDSPDIHKLM